MSRRPQNGEQGWGNILNSHLDVALDANTGQVKPAGINPGNDGQILTTSGGSVGWSDPGTSGVGAVAQVLTTGLRAWVNFDGRPQNGTYTIINNVCLVTMNNHGVKQGMRVTLQFTSGGMQSTTPDAASAVAYDVVSADTNTFTVNITAGNTSGNVTRQTTIRAHANIDRIVKYTTGGNSAGDYIVHFVDPMPDTYYAVTVGQEHHVAVNWGVGNNFNLPEYLANSFRIVAASEAGVYNPQTLNLAIFR
jgi:hypothetical protein